MIWVMDLRLRLKFVHCLAGSMAERQSARDAAPLLETHGPGEHASQLAHGLADQGSVHRELCYGNDLATRTTIDALQP